jgi:hypothetical protein
LISSDLPVHLIEHIFIQECVLKLHLLLPFAVGNVKTIELYYRIQHRACLGDSLEALDVK